ncbi:hypothetical protein [Nocardiopsis algeriensis]|uniref:Uncharacterized protein n=1 Tax=Nocardiopsis algeriensis TaxID=1478215 RepID=A0A841IRB4_9ACTN|nr:hypothetical protein [Nocardiopsis algeriensis]MBB6120652.1 hypothetical protein [Nocardiopsis algeriensis]
MKKISQKVPLISSFAVVSLLVSLGVASASPETRTEDLESLGAAKGNHEKSEDLTAEINQAQINERGNLLSITWSIANPSSERVVLTWLSGRSYTYSGANFAGVTIIDENRGARHHPIMDGLGSCLCSGDSSANFKSRLEPGEQVAYWSLYSVSEGVEEITVEIPRFEPIEDIPIS